ncbi:MAG: aminopeptidase N, partial [Pseudomonadota bacterium]
MRTQTGPAIRLEDYKPSDYLIDQVELDFKLEPEETIVTSTLQIRRRDGVPANAPLRLHGDELELMSLSIDGTDSTGLCKLDNEGLEIAAVPSSSTFALNIVTRINPTSNKKLMGLYRTSGNFCTQCEAEGFRRITYYLDRPDVLSVFNVRIEGDKKDVPLLLSNGNCINSGDLDGNRHFAEWHDPHPKPAYLFALFAGDLGVIKDQFTTVSGRQVALEIYVEHGKEPRAAYAMDALIRSMTWDEDVYGCEYDLDVFMIVAVSDFNMGAMENKGLNIFNDKYVLADPETATDLDYANIEAIIAHEYFHNWTGNRITCRDWFQLCLKEGLTVYRDHTFSADMRSAPVKRIAEVRALRAHQFPEDSGPLAHPVRPRKYAEINNFYTSTVYEKGSEVIGMLRTILGADGFKAGMDLYFERHDGDASTIEDFLKCFVDATGEDLGQFALWYDQPGTPNLAIATKYDATTKRFSVNIAQSNKPIVVDENLAPMHIPVRFGLLGADGSDMTWTGVTGADVIGNVIHL